MDAKSAGRRIKEIREGLQMSKKACAEKAGITPRYFAEIELGAKTPSMNIYVQIANVLHASTDFILQDSLAIGYIPQSNTLLKRTEELTPVNKKVAMNIIEGTVNALLESQKSSGE